jgi:hypothetical protein
MKYFFGLLVIVCLPILTSAQSLYTYLGNGMTVPDSVSPELQIQFNSRGFEYVTAKRLSKSEQHLIALGAPHSQIKKLMNFPNQNYGEWVESSYRAALSQFTKCGGPIADAASAFSPNTVFVSFEPVPFADPTLPLANGELLAGEYVSATHEIRAVAFYKSQADGDLAYLPVIMAWEWGNAIADHIGIVAEPRGTNWPCQ